MIIGKSLTALGGGGLKPEIRVTAKAGALLNLHYKDSSIILQSYQLGASETTHTFVVSVSETAYLVEDVTNSASVEVLVDAVAVFDVKIPYSVQIIQKFQNSEAWTLGYNSATVTCTKMYSETYLHPGAGVAMPDGYLYSVGVDGGAVSATYKNAYVETPLFDCTDFSTLEISFACRYTYTSSYPAVYLAISVLDDQNNLISEIRRTADTDTYFGLLEAEVSDKQSVKIRVTNNSPGNWWGACAFKSMLLS